MSEPRICIVGAGHLSTERIYPYIGAAGGVLVGVCDLDSKKAQRNARRFGGTPYSVMDDMLDVECPDGVIICIGPEAHALLAPTVMRRGIPVYTEKPPALTSQAALGVALVSQETGVLCSTAFKKRYATAYKRAKDWLNAYPEEHYASISVDYASGGYPNDSPRASFLLDFAIHVIDLVGFLFGDIAEVFAFAKGLDAYAVSLKFANGAVGSLNLTDTRSYTIPTEEVEISIHGGNAMTIRNSSSWRITENEQPCEWHEPLTYISAGDSGNDTGHFAEIAGFLRAVTEQRTTCSNIYESYKSMVLYEAIRESAESGQVVQMRYADLKG